MSENPNIVYGRLLESAHISGYGFERVVDELEWLMQDDRWQQVGQGYQQFGAFLESIDLSAFNINRESRRKLAQRMAELDASTRQTAKALGVGQRTIARDIASEPGGSPAPEKSAEQRAAEPVAEPGGSPAPKPPPEPFQQPAKAVADQTRQATTRQRKEAGREQQRQANAEAVATGSSLDLAPDATYRTVVFDPPWSWDDEGDASQLGRARPRYHTMSFDEIAALPIGDYAEPDAHIYLWITNRSLPKGAALLDGWGFRYITALTWCKPSFGMGTYYRGSTEHALFGVRGSLPLLRNDRGTWFADARGDGHSAKPDGFYQLVEQCSPGPWVDILGRKERPGWATVSAIETA